MLNLIKWLYKILAVQNSRTPLHNRIIQGFTFPVAGKWPILIFQEGLEKNIKNIEIETRKVE